MSLDRYAIDSDSYIAYSINQISKLTSISRSKLFMEIKNGNLKVFKCGKRTLATKQAIDDWIQKLSDLER